MLASFIILTTNAQKDGHPYESLENVCGKCTCTQKENSQLTFYVLDCISRNFTQILAGYPSSFDLTDKGIDM